MKNLLFIFLISGGSLLAAQEQDNRFNETEHETVGSSSLATQKQDKRFNESEQEEVITGQRGPGTDTPGGDLEDTDSVPIDKNSGWLVIIALAIIIYHTVQRKKTFGK